jgi:sarcosine oxidase subunit alpha
METISVNERRLKVNGLRIKDAVSRGKRFEFTFDGEPVQAYAGETIATALVAANKLILNTSEKQSHPRGVFCGIGLCFGCLVTVNGTPNVRACQTDAGPRMVVESQHGNGKLRMEH